MTTILITGANLPKADGSKLVLVKLDSAVETDAADAVTKLKEDHGITSLDTVIANAGIAVGGDTVRNTTAANVRAHVAVNTLGPTSSRPAGRAPPKFVAVSSFIGSVGGIDVIASLGFPGSASPYGGSKAALNWFVRRLHFEEPWLTSFVLHPGLVETDLAAKSIDGTGLRLEDIGAVSVETSVGGITKLVDAATRETSGTFQNYDEDLITESVGKPESWKKTSLEALSLLKPIIGPSGNEPIGDDLDDCFTLALSWPLTINVNFEEAVRVGRLEAVMNLGHFAVAMQWCRASRIFGSAGRGLLYDVIAHMGPGRERWLQRPANVMERTTRQSPAT
ncbi:Norsolorinic acid ketoreductase [Colletotrichum sidae]|uniref:Norsolorinic acid ketoreductase n=1 Tax=Colletotrichum sidae TaxID=1347389 RepID=A0A4R8TB29_9PEZI|nr:Norsolorinic acid ketoreductase [Colletotrichum sidae]